MYGYIVPDVKQLNAWDYCVLTGHYCGHCFCIKQMFGNIARFTTNHDFAYLSAFLHELFGIEPRFEGSRCIVSPFKQKTVVLATPLMERVVSANIIFAYFKLLDATDDEGRNKAKISSRMLKKAYNKAANMEPEIDALLKEQYKIQHKLELEGSKDYDAVSNPTATILRETVRILSDGKADETVLELFFNLGKFIYFADAIDDIAKDARSGAFNVILNNIEYNKKVKQFVKLNEQEIAPLLDGPCAEIERLFGSLPGELQSSLNKNILLYGLPHTKGLLLNK